MSTSQPIKYRIGINNIIEEAPTNQLFSFFAFKYEEKFKFNLSNAPKA
jgi:phosphosulfolactate synthase (CoM biosynthesis protein A)